MLTLELHHAVFGLDQLLFVRLDLLAQEFLRGIRVLAGLPQRAFHEDREQGLDHALGHVGVVVLIANGVEIGLPAGRGNLDVVAKLIEQRFHLLRGLRLNVEVGHAGDLLQVRARQQGTRHQAHAVTYVRANRKPAQQRPQHGIRIHVHPRRSLELVRELLDEDPARDRRDPCHQQDVPAVAPGPLHIAQELADEVVHLEEPP